LSSDFVNPERNRGRRSAGSARTLRPDKLQLQFTTLLYQLPPVREVISDMFQNTDFAGSNPKVQRDDGEIRMSGRPGRPEEHSGGLRCLIWNIGGVKR
jgi:hypothetical protein